MVYLCSLLRRLPGILHLWLKVEEHRDGHNQLNSNSWILNINASESPGLLCAGSYCCCLHWLLLLRLLPYSHSVRLSCRQKKLYVLLRDQLPGAEEQILTGDLIQNKSLPKTIIWDWPFDPRSPPVHTTCFLQSFCIYLAYFSQVASLKITSRTREVFSPDSVLILRELVITGSALPVRTQLTYWLSCPPLKLQHKLRQVPNTSIAGSVEATVIVRQKHGYPHKNINKTGLEFSVISWQDDDIMTKF